MKKILICVVLGVLFFAGIAQTGFCDVRTFNGRQRIATGKLIIQFDPALSETEKTRIQNTHGLTLESESIKKNPKGHASGHANPMFSRFSPGKSQAPQALIDKLSKEDGVLFAEQDAYAYALMVPDDTYYNPYQWNMSAIDMESAWELSSGQGVVVAVMDTGVLQTLEDFKNTQFTTGYDFVNQDSDPADDEGHGSHVAGTIAQSTGNGVGVAGIAYNCTIMPIKVLDSEGAGYYSDIVDGIYYAVDNGADIINMSLGGLENLQALQEAVAYAEEKGVLIVSAAGNDGSTEPCYPAAYDSVLSVSATGYGDSLASYSNYGDTIDICAPGGEDTDLNGDGYSDYILQNSFEDTAAYGGGGPHPPGWGGGQTVRTTGYYFLAGTSCAVPHVSGVAALIKSVNPDLTASTIRNILESTAVDLGESGWDVYFGHGRINAYEAVVAAVSATNDDASQPDDSQESEDTENEDESAVETMHVGNIEFTGKYAKKSGSCFTAAITVVDSSDTPVSGATVTIRWSVGNGYGSGGSLIDTGTTGSDGDVYFSACVHGGFVPIVTISVEDVTHASFDYSPSDNTETTDAIALQNMR